MKQNLELHLLDSELTLHVRDFRVEEAMNKPFEIFLSVLSPESLDLTALIGQNARFEAALTPTGSFLEELLASPIVGAWIEREKELEASLKKKVALIPGASEAIDAARAAMEAELTELRRAIRDELPSADWSGIVADIEETGAEINRSTLYRVHLVHPLWVLAQNKNYRIFQHLSELDIARILIAEWDIDDNPLLDPKQYKKRDFRIQYGESDLEFIQRNLEDLGISYYLEDTDDGEVITLSPNPERNEPREESLRYYDQPLKGTRTAWASGLNVRRVVRPGKYTLQDVDYRFPPERQPRLTSQFAVEREDDPAAHFVSPLERVIETYEYNPGAFAVEAPSTGDSPSNDRKQATRTDTKYGTWLTEVRLRSVQSSRYRIQFDTNAFDLHPGAVTRIDGHARPELADPVLVIQSTFTGNETGDWKMRCVAHPTKIPYMPEMVTRRPRAGGVETATVVGVPKASIDPQELGSVLVQFHWDREGTRDDNSSCWVPVSYGLAGASRGMFSLPRIGEEVLVDFLAGDLDKPMITGRVYTGLNKPWTTDVKSMGDFSIKNDSLDSASQHTGIHMTADTHPLIHVFSTHDKQLTVGNDERNKVTRDSSTTIGNTRSSRIGSHCSTEVGGNSSQKVRRNRSTRIGGNASEIVNRGKTVFVRKVLGISAKDQVGIHSDAGMALTCKAAMRVESLGGITTIKGKDKVCIKAGTAIELEVGGSLVLIRENMIIVQSARTYINPGGTRAQTAKNTGIAPPTADDLERAKVVERTPTTDKQREYLDKEQKSLNEQRSTAVDPDHLRNLDKKQSELDQEWVNQIDDRKEREKMEREVMKNKRLEE